MGTILSFEPRKPSAQRPPATLSAQSSVIIFPGVRYERYSVPEAKPVMLRAKPARRPATPAQS